MIWQYCHIRSGGIASSYSVPRWWNRDTGREDRRLDRDRSGSSAVS